MAGRNESPTCPGLPCGRRQSGGGNDGGTGAERQRRLGELGDKINDIKRKRRAAQDDEELDRGVKKAKVLFKAITTYP